MSVTEEKVNGLKLTPQEVDARTVSDFAPQTVKPFHREELLKPLEKFFFGR